MTSLKLFGARELDNMLKAMKASTAKTVTKRAMVKALEPVAVAARAAAPRLSGGGPHMADKIAASTTLSKAQLREGRKLSGGFDVGGRDTALAYVGPESALAHLVEFGTGPRFLKNGKFVGIMPPNPFMRQAWDATKGAVLDGLTDLLRAEIEKSLTRAAKRTAGQAAKAAKSGGR